MDVILTNTVGLLVAAIIVALIARRLRLPYTVGLVVTGIALALIRNDRGAVLTHALAGMSDRIKVEPVTGSCEPCPCHGHLTSKR